MPAQLEQNHWFEMVSYLRKNHEDLWRQWFDKLDPSPVRNGLMRVVCASEVQRKYLQKNCQDAFRDAAQNATGALVALRFVTSHSEETDEETITTISKPQAAPVTAETAAQILEESASILNPDSTFDSFVPGPNSDLAYAAAQAVAEKPGEAYNPLFLHGGIGIGKTHLLHAICQATLEKNPSAHIVYTSCEAFSRAFLACVQAGTMDTFRKHFRRADMLVIDDIHFLSSHERSQEEFFHTFNELHQAHKQIVLSSDAAPDIIPELEERLVSRFNWGLVARINKPDYETRMAIVKSKASLREISLPDAVAELIARRVDSSPRDLEGALVNLQGHARLRHRPIDMTLAREVLGEPAHPSRTNQKTMQAIVQSVCNFYQLQPADLQSRRRHRSITEPRQLTMWLARKHTRYSLQEIGGQLGGRDHTTVMHSIRSVDKRNAEDLGYLAQVEQIEQQIMLEIG